MARKRSLLFVLWNSDIGGPQKSLLALLDRIDRDKFETFLYVVLPGGPLEPFFEDRAHVLESDALITAASLPSANPVRSLVVLVKYRRFRILYDAVRAMLRHLFLGANMNQERQRIWLRHSQDLPAIPGVYDAAFGILGNSSYCVLDSVDASKRYHWVRSDSRILQRDEAIDGAYFRRMDGALAVSQQCASIYEEMYASMRGRVRVLHNYIPLQFYRNLDVNLSLMVAPSNHTKVLTVCRLDPLKGIEMAIAACRQLVDSGVPVRWFVLGDGRHRAEVEEMIEANGLQDDFLLLGFHLNTLAFIEECDVFVHASRTEGKANVVDEAKYVGKPIVVTNYATVADQIRDGIDGLVCEMNPHAIAESVESLINDKELAARLAASSRGREDGLQDVNAFFGALLEE